MKCREITKGERRLFTCYKKDQKTWKTEVRL